MKPPKDFLAETDEYGGDTRSPFSRRHSSMREPAWHAMDLGSATEDLVGLDPTELSHDANHNLIDADVNPMDPDVQNPSEYAHRLMGGKRQRPES